MLPKGFADGRQQMNSVFKNVPASSSFDDYNGTKPKPTHDIENKGSSFVDMSSSIFY